MPSSIHPNPNIDPDTINTYINNATAPGSPYSNVPPALSSAIASQESSYDINISNSSKGAVGVMQVEPATAANLIPGANVYDTQQNVTLGVALQSQLMTAYNGDQQKTIAGYFDGQPNVDSAIAKATAAGNPQNWLAYTGPATQAYVAGVNSKLATNGGLAPGVGNGTGQSPRINQNVPPLSAPDPISANVIPVAPITPGTYEALVVATASTPDLVGLNNQPWYQDKALVDGNTETGNYPVSFQVYLDQANPASILSNPLTNQPITVNLNCSISKYSLALKHIANMEPTRTGFHITLWGMQADMITGEGSTGVFMNRFGLTDYYSLAGVPSYASALVTKAYKLTNKGVDVFRVASESGNPIPPVNHTLAAVQQMGFEPSESVALQTNLEPFRIKAEDAFQEFLATFKMNATTWLHPTGYGSDSTNSSPDIPNPNQTSVFSQTVGASSDMVKARNNDVYKRGYVVMRFHNSQYLGFFKSLSFTMSADKPYQWRFNFVFQVERTLTLVYYAGNLATPAPGLAVTSGLVTQAQADSFIAGGPPVQ
jgi:hypothetical protein